LDVVEAKLCSNQLRFRKTVLDESTFIFDVFGSFALIPEIFEKNFSNIISQL